jgi:hypothetical protein
MDTSLWLVFAQLTRIFLFLGCVAFIGVAVFFLTRPSFMIHWQDKLVFATFFVGAICCLGKQKFGNFAYQNFVLTFQSY